MILLGYLVASCTSQPNEQHLQQGDLLFQSAGSSSLSQAIDEVTQTNSATHFSHLGMVRIKSDRSLVVMHASTENGTCEISLNDFLTPKEKKVQTVLYRLKTSWQYAIPKAIVRAENMLNKPYNFSYILSDSAHYCSEYIFKAFQEDSIFILNPMTFKNPKTGKFLDNWTQHYKDLGVEIPEGKLGCNPNGMATSKKLECLGELTFKHMN